MTASVTEGPGRVRPTRAEIDLAAIAHNVAVLTQAADGAQVCAVVKADGYGHGALEVARAAVGAGATWLAVALVEEGEVLRAAGLTAPILLLTEPPVAAVPRIVAAELTPVVYTPGFGAALAAAGRAAGRSVAVHLKVDTGMGRVGVPAEDWPDFLDAAVAGWGEGITVEGVMTHLARADEPAADTTAHQLARFDQAIAAATRRGLAWPLTHAANSAATLLHPRARRDLVRTGIALYGLSPGADVPAGAHGLRPALRLVTEVAFAKRVAAGTSVSYGHTWSAPADGWIATLPVGYADGVPRGLSNRAEVLIDGCRMPIAGNVCMDQILVWCGDHEVAAGDEVVLLGRQGDAVIVADEWAAIAGSITYEIATGIGVRIPRVYR